MNRGERRRPGAAAGAIVLIHGVGFGPELLEPVVRELGDGTLVMERRGYGRRASLAPAPRVEDHVTDLVALLDRASIQTAVVAGASGGATVALAAALLAPERVAGAVCHEPAAGTAAPELQGLVREALSAGGGARLAEVLAGPRTWSALAPALRDTVQGRSDILAADAQAFLEWEPAFSEAATAAPVRLTVGARSAPLRLAIAARLGERLAAPVIVLENCGHLPQLDAPHRFAAVVRAAYLDSLSERGAGALDQMAIPAEVRQT